MSEITGNTSYIIRNYRPADFEEYVLLCQEAEKLEPYQRPVFPQAIAGRLSRPGCSPEQNLFVCETSGRLIGFMDMVLELQIGRAVLHCWLHPEHRRAGLARRLLDSALHHALEAGARLAHVNILEDNTVAKMALPRLGFHFVRRFLELELDMAGLRWQETNWARECRHLKCGEEDKLTQIQNLSFAEHWGYSPNTVATTIHHIELNRCSPEDIILACDGDRITGFCWTEAVSQREGRIFMLGVVPDCRDRGTGRRLLLAGLSRLKSTGRQAAVLAVDSENKKACALYHSVGFKIRSSSLWYEKAISQET